MARKPEQELTSLRHVADALCQEQTFKSGEKRRYLNWIRELEAIVTAMAEAQAHAEPVGDSSSDLQRDRLLMEMLVNLYRLLNVAMESVNYGKLPQPRLSGTPTTPGHYVLALQPVAEQLEAITTKARSAMDAELWQSLSDAVLEILVVAKAYDLLFPSEYILRAMSTAEDE